MTEIRDSAEFDALLQHLKHTRRFDFSGYKRASLLRRVVKRMQAVNIEGFLDYQHFLSSEPDEFNQLFNTILINVSSFFRDPAMWQYLAHDIVPRIRGAQRQDDLIRIWSAGCASGEEAYSLAMLMAESGCRNGQVKIYATDVDEDALSKGRHGSYSAGEVQGVSPQFLSRHFESNGERYIVRRDLRRWVIFGRHDLMQDPPISRVSLIVCRNTLMYFNSEAQARILNRFKFALNNGGFLFLGRAELVLTQGELFVPYDLKHRVFVKTSMANSRDRQVSAMADGHGTTGVPSDEESMRTAAFDSDPVAQIVVDVRGRVTLINERARTLFGLTAMDVGRPFQDLEVSYKPVELRKLVEQAYSEHRTVTAKDIEWIAGGVTARWLEVQVLPLMGDSKRPIGAKIVFTDVTVAKTLQQEVQHSKEELETAYEELQSTNEELQTTNEELQSTVEELETTNEELQSTNEELETMNEELQSTNAQMETVNEELRLRGEQLGDANQFLSAILSSLSAAVIVLDSDMRVQAWNSKAEDLWGLRSEEVRGKHLMNLDVGLPVDQLRPMIRACLSGDDSHPEVKIEATTRRGRTIQLHVTCSTLGRVRGDARGVILLVNEAV